MPRDLIIDSFAGGGVSEGSSLREYLEVDPFMPGKEHHSDLTFSTPHDATKYVAIGIFKVKKDIVGQNISRIDRY